MSRAQIAAALTALLLPVPHAHAASAPPTETMPFLGTVADPAGGAPDSMVIAFDGDVFYYTDAVPGVIDRAQVVHVGPTVASKPLTPFKVPVSPERLGYDAHRRALLLYDASGTVSVFDLKTEKVTSRVTLASQDTLYAGDAFDWSRDTYTNFNYISGKGYAFFHMRRNGRVSGTCLFAKSAYLYPSALAAAGNGDIYVQSEDDETVYTVTRTCHVTGAWTHRVVAESIAEDDSIVCDGVTFATPAIWIRDPATATMSAYGLPRGACLLPTAMRFTVTKGTGCAKLTRFETGTPLAGLTVGIGRTKVSTNSTGLACATVSTKPGRHRVTATFAGTRSWAASRATASYTIPAPPVRRPAVRPPVPRRPAWIYAAPVNPVSGAAAPPPPPVHIAPHAAPQPGYGNSPVTQAAPFGVAIPQSAEEAHLAYASNGDSDSSRLPTDLLAASLTAAAAAGLRRRTSISVARARGRP